MNFKTLAAAQRWIESVVRFKDKYDLTRMNKACEMLGHPERTFKSIHVGGTNGKGSTLTFLKEILMDASYHVGTFMSPYVVRFNERITLDDALISDEELLIYINRIYEFQQTYLEKENDQISFFELLTLISFLYFADKDVDVVLYEVGLGGRLDATNVITPELSIITSIGHDHMHILGDTLKKVTLEKLGIVKEGVPLVDAVMQETLIPVIDSYINKMNSPVQHLVDVPLKNTFTTSKTFTYKHERYALSVHGTYQIQNARLALLACEMLNEKTVFDIPLHAMRSGIKAMRMPGRFEIIGNVILDGAHNPEGIFEGVKALKYYAKKLPVTVLFTVMRDKDYGTMQSALETIATHIIYTQLPKERSEKASILLKNSHHVQAQAHTDFKKALSIAQHLSKNGVVYVCGSLYFISSIRKELVE
jgi:dihydrofolate synthase/folylpolyglutamate synthase